MLTKRSQDPGEWELHSRKLIDWVLLVIWAGGGRRTLEIRETLRRDFRAHVQLP